mmetsp:Transcript_22510/g.51537  ORF Transcript_22510/g.51537 Transcript_22510/m.51537 type:complete len:204 (+) Transcript_22510:1902-2513(+)
MQYFCDWNTITRPIRFLYLNNLAIRQRVKTIRTSQPAYHAKPKQGRIVRSSVGLHERMNEHPIFLFARRLVRGSANGTEIKTSNVRPIELPVVSPTLFQTLFSGPHRDRKFVATFPGESTFPRDRQGDGHHLPLGIRYYQLNDFAAFKIDSEAPPAQYGSFGPVALVLVDGHGFGGEFPDFNSTCAFFRQHQRTFDGLHGRSF